MLRAREHGGPEKNAFDSRLFFGFSQRASGRGKAKRWKDFFVIWPFTCLYIFKGLIIVFMSWSAASKCGKTHPCDYRISKFFGGACPRNPLGGKALLALPILCPGVKLSCPPVQNLNAPPVMMVSMLSWLRWARSCWSEMVSGQKISRILLRFFVWKVVNLFMSGNPLLLPYMPGGIHGHEWVSDKASNLEDLDVDFILQHFNRCLFVNEGNVDT